MPFKKILLSFIFFLASAALWAQPHLSLTSITGSSFPASGDTVYEYQPYDSLVIIVMNQDTVPFLDSLSILIKGNSNTPDTIHNDFFQPIQGGGQATIVDSAFNFKASNFDDGDNIVVIWPAAKHSQPQIDSLSLHIFYVSKAISVPEINNEPVSLYPNPATGYIFLGDDVELMIKQVRIIDDTGRLIYEDPKLNKIIMIDQWKCGIYLIDIEKKDGSHRLLKLVKS